MELQGPADPHEGTGDSLVSNDHHLRARQTRLDENVQHAATVALHRNVDHPLPLHAERRGAAESQEARSALFQ